MRTAYLNTADKSASYENEYKGSILKRDSELNDVIKNNGKTAGRISEHLYQKSGVKID